MQKLWQEKLKESRDNVRRFLTIASEKNISILKVYEAIKIQLVHDLTKDAFADMYAQTLVYGLFVARYHDETPDNFTRREAAELIPKSNPLLRHFFDHIAGSDFDKRLEYIVNELCTVFSHADVKQLMKQYFEEDLWGEVHGSPDPVIHFYEDFLKEYDAELRKKMGAYYTPLPVVKFIVRSVDYLLQQVFNLPSGLADSSKLDRSSKTSIKNLHRVQILDPAAGTGTFLNTVILELYSKFLKSGQTGRWPEYVFHELLPRLHGFELMMSPYTIAHLKLSMTLKDLGFKHFNERRLGIYLTNSLEESDPQQVLITGFGFAESIAEESKEAGLIKNETPIMVVIGNPPYSVSSENKSPCDS
ncbi:MAG: N-6 DNA methylase [Ignavibacteriaceae bacterium]|nr:N-6 DNA methylase [Ignavibacteriaceae bacterium]